MQTSDGLWDEDTWWSDSREGAFIGPGGLFKSLQVLMMRRELLWSCCCCSALFLCAFGRPVSSHLPQTLAVVLLSILLTVLSLLHHRLLLMCHPLFGEEPFSLTAS